MGVVVVGYCVVIGVGVYEGDVFVFVNLLELVFFGEVVVVFVDWVDDVGDECGVGGVVVKWDDFVVVFVYCGLY